MSLYHIDSLICVSDIQEKTLEKSCQCMPLRTPMTARVGRGTVSRKTFRSQESWPSTVPFFEFLPRTLGSQTQES